MVSVILLAGGRGTRMESALPKQYLPLHDKPVVHHSLEIFQSHPEVTETIVVCAPEFGDYFKDFDVKIALSGERRQDSVFNGLKSLSETSEWILVHDGVRPFITPTLISRLIEEGQKVGAATLAVPVKNTLKRVEGNRVATTPDREKYWEVQTPQFLRKSVMEKGFAYAQTHALCVTDDVSLAELIDHPVTIVEGAYNNVKITTPEDLIFAQCLATNS